MPCIVRSLSFSAVVGLVALASLLCVGCATVGARDSVKNGDLDSTITSIEGGTSNPEAVDGCGWNLLHLAVYYQHQSIVEYLVGRPVKVDVKTTKHSISCITFSHVPAGSTPLLIAAFYGNRAIVQTLLRHGADPRSKDAEGHTALSYAQDFQFPAVERVLRKALGQP